MKEQYKTACVAYLEQYKKTIQLQNSTHVGWHHLIDSSDFKGVGAVATAQILLLIKNCDLDVNFCCLPIVETLLDKQNDDGGWSYSSNIICSATEPTALSIQALLTWEELWVEPMPFEGVVSAVEKGIDWLLKHANPSRLWGPINKKEQNGYIYFSCVALRCLNRFLCYNRIGINKALIDDARIVLSTGCASLLSSFKTDDTQCGWGKTVNAHATLFHTAYTVITLLEIDLEYSKKYPIIRSLAFLSDYEECNQHTGTRHVQYDDGMSEVYQKVTKRNHYRIRHTHSVDVYILIALLLGNRQNSPAIMEKCKDYIKYAERTEWRYQGLVTCWRLYDIISLCNAYTTLIKEGVKEEMGQFKIALTFAGENRNLVEEIALILADYFSKEEILYDKFHEAVFARPQLDIYLQKLYHDCSDLIVVFLCNDYHKKRWCNVEWRAVRDILNNLSFEKIMYIKVSDGDVDNISLPGFYGSQDGYIDVNGRSPQEIAALIIERYNWA